MKRSEIMNPYNYENNINTYRKYPYLNGYLDYGVNNKVLENEYLPGSYYKNADLMQLGSCRCKKSYFRVLNTYAEVPLDVQINEILMAENFKIGEFTRYVQFAPGTYRVKIYESKDPSKLIFETNIDIGKNLAYTGVIAKDDADPSDIGILMIPEAKDNSITGRMSAVRMTNLALDAPDLDLAASDGTVLFSGINYGDVSNNVAVPSGIYTLQLRTKDGKNNVLEVSNVDFAPKMHYTLFIAGKGINNTDVQIIIPEDGVNYLDIC